MQKKLKQVTYSSEKSSFKNLWFFQSSLYEVIIIYPARMFPYIKISTESLIQHFQVIQHPSIDAYFLIIVTKSGTWIGYQINIEGKQLKVNQISKSSLLNIEQKVVGVHILTEELMVIFVKEKGKLEYNFIQMNNNQRHNFKTFVVNKNYSVEISNEKYKKSNLYSQYQGRELLQIKNQNKILHSVFNFTTKELFVVTQDINSKVCSINKFFLQDYHIIMGSDALLNLPAKPLQVLLWSALLIINFSHTLLLWCRNITQLIQLPLIGTCNEIKQVDKQTFLITIIQDNNTHVFSMQIIPTGKENHNIANIKFQKFVDIKHDELILYYNPTQYPKNIPALSLTSKLQVVQWLKDNTWNKILPNMQAHIIDAQLHKLNHSNYLTVIKKVGCAIEHKIITNNRIVGSVDEYQHNMLIKMANVQHYLSRNGSGEVFITSPIIGTLKLVISFNMEKQSKNKKQLIQQNMTISISTGTKQQNMNYEQESLCLNVENFQQLTPTKIITPKTKLSISQLFEGNTDMILAGAFIGYYIALGVQKQVHIFNLEPKPKRIHINCFDSQIKNIIALNTVNLWGVLFWDGSFQVLRIQEKQSVKIYQVDELGHNFSQNYLCFNVNINTAPHTISIIGNYMLIASNDPLHIYQPQKSTLKGIKLDNEKFGQYFYPVIDISQSKSTQQKYTVLSNIQSRWMLINIPSKILVKSIQEIKLQVQQIIAFPKIQSLVISVVKDSYIFILTTNKIIICNLKTGSITYNTQFPFSLDKNYNPSDHLDYLRRWLNNQTVSHERFKIQARADMNLTHPNFIKLNENRVLLYNQKQIWYASLDKEQIKLISYFSMANDAFLEFRNNLGVQQLQNLQFMDIFAEKLPISSVTAISDTLIAVLYSKMIVLVEISNNGGIIIKQELPFSQCPGLISITQFVGVFDEMSIFLKDQSHRLVLLKYNEKNKKYFLQIQHQLDDQIVCIHRLKGWNDRTKKLNINNNEQDNNFEEMIVKKDGQMVIGNDGKQLYI